MLNWTTKCANRHKEQRCKSVQHIYTFVLFIDGCCTLTRRARAFAYKHTTPAILHNKYLSISLDNRCCANSSHMRMAWHECVYIRLCDQVMFLHSSIEFHLDRIVSSEQDHSSTLVPGEDRARIYIRTYIYVYTCRHKPAVRIRQGAHAFPRCLRLWLYIIKTPTLCAMGEIKHRNRWHLKPTSCVYVFSACCCTVRLPFEWCWWVYCLGSGAECKDSLDESRGHCACRMPYWRLEESCDSQVVQAVLNAPYLCAMKVDSG